MENLELWNQVCETDPKRTKRQTHGAKLTSIDAYSQIKQATELWGPIGKEWGFRNVSMRTEGEFPNQLLLFIAEFYYPDGKFPALNSIALSPTTKYGNEIVGDCVKRVMTDTITKCLSYLGFSADVFMGKFDNRDYVAEMNEKYNNTFKPMTESQKEQSKRLFNYLSAYYGSEDMAKNGILKDCKVKASNQISTIVFKSVWEKYEQDVITFEEKTGGK